MIVLLSTTAGLLAQAAGVGSRAWVAATAAGLAHALATLGPPPTHSPAAALAWLGGAAVCPDAVLAALALVFSGLPPLPAALSPTVTAAYRAAGFAFATLGGPAGRAPRAVATVQAWLAARQGGATRAAAAAELAAGSWLALRAAMTPTGAVMLVVAAVRAFGPARGWVLVEGQARHAALSHRPQPPPSQHS